MALEVNDVLAREVTEPVNADSGFRGQVGRIGRELVNPLAGCLVEACPIIPVRAIVCHPVSHDLFSREG